MIGASRGYAEAMEPLTAERRRRPRISAMMLCEIRAGSAAPEVVRIRDFSECGLRIATRLPMLVGGHVRIRLPGVEEWWLARVAWRDGPTAGLAFLRAVDFPHSLVALAVQAPAAAIRSDTRGIGALRIREGR